MNKKNGIGIFVFICFIIFLTIMALTPTSKQENIYEKRIEKLETEITALESELDYYKEESKEMELYFEYLKDISNLNEILVKEGIYIDFNGTGHYFDVPTIEYEVDYVQFYTDIESFIHYYTQWYSSDPQITFSMYLQDIDNELYERLQYYDDVYYEIKAND